MSSDGVLYEQAPSVLIRTVGPDVLAAAATGERFDLLQGTAASVWHALRTPTTFDVLVATLARSFDAPQEVLARDLERLLADLVERELVKVR